MAEEELSGVECKDCECPIEYCCCDAPCSVCAEAPTHCTCEEYT